MMSCIYKYLLHLSFIKFKGIYILKLYVANRIYTGDLFGRLFFNINTRGKCYIDTFNSVIR